MNSDGWGQVGAGQDDRRLAGSDLQHYGQSRAADKAPQPTRIVRESRESGGPMKHHLESKHEVKEISHHPMHHHLEEEKHRHHEAMEHHHHHLSRHHSRHHDSQHGHDHYQYHK